MRTVTLGGVPGRVVLGEGIPKTIVPLTASSLEALLAECAAAAQAGCDIVEWRIDHFAGFRAAPPGDAPRGAPSWPPSGRRPKAGPAPSRRQNTRPSSTRLSAAAARRRWTSSTSAPPA